MKLVKACFLAAFFTRIELFSSQANKTVIEYQPVSLRCNATSLANIRVTWVKDNDRGTILSRNITLTFSRVLRVNDGRYICNATNGTWHFTDNIYLSVRYPPTITLSPNRTVLENTSSSLTCNAIGNPVPAITFFKDGKQLKTGRNLKQVILNFKAVLRYHAGWYKCTASNGIGNNDTTTTYLDVQYPPEMSITDDVISSWLGKLVHTRCNTTGNPLPSVTWYKNSHVIASGAMLVVNITSREQFGTYQCVANNSRGSDSRDVELRRTRFPPNSTVITNNATIIESRNFTLTWSEPNDNGSPIINYYVWKQHMYMNGSKGRWERSSAAPSLRERWFVVAWGASYRFYVSARNDQGQTNGQSKNFTVIDEPHIQVEPRDGNWIIYASAGGGALLIIIIIFVVCCIRRRSNETPLPCPKEQHFNHRMLMEELSPTTPISSQCNDRYSVRQTPLSQNQRENTSSEEVTSEPSSAIYDNLTFADNSVEDWEVPRKNVDIEKIIGKGAFCQVAKAFVSGIGTVAVKMLRGKGNNTSNREDLLAEFKLLQNLGTHENVILVLGGVTKTDPVMVFFEYVPYGDLLGYLRRSRGLTDTYYTDPDNQPSSTLTSKQMMRFSREIADGMAFISSKKIIHRDLAARNVLVGQGETCKITDFGMARDVKNDDIYQKRRRGRLPVKWTAYEALLYGFYSTQSDVWSYAIVLYEIFTIGGSPYPDMDPRTIADKIYQGYRMPKPKHLDDEIYALMTECWRTTPEQRPTFDSISSTLRRLERHEKNYIHMNQYDVDLYANLDEI